jgi:hypothetical protein
MALYWPLWVAMMVCGLGLVAYAAVASAWRKRKK